MAGRPTGGGPQVIERPAAVAEGGEGVGQALFPVLVDGTGVRAAGDLGHLPRAAVHHDVPRSRIPLVRLGQSGWWLSGHNSSLFVTERSGRRASSERTTGRNKSAMSIQYVPPAPAPLEHLLRARRIPLRIVEFRRAPL